VISTVGYESVGGNVLPPVVAADPQPSFSAPRELGLYRVELKLESEPSGCAPVLAWDTGSGFTKGQSRAFRRLQDNRFLTECAVDATWKRWRLDAGATRGPLLIRSLKMTPIVRPPSFGSTGAWGATIWPAARSLLDHALGSYTTTDLALDDAPFPSGFEDAAHVSNGATRLRVAAAIRPGWYMLELRVEIDGVRADARVYLEGENGDRALLPLPMRSGQLVKRLVFVETPTVMRLLPLAAPRAFAVLHFRLARVPVRFARSRIERKLSSRHPRYMALATLATSGAGQPSISGSLDTRSLWAEYNRVFDRCGELVSYDEWIDAVERRDCPDPREQAATIRGWQERPMFSIVVQAHDSDEAALVECLDSVLEQTYSHCELCIVDDATSAQHVRRILFD
jgi:hypothetical protein